jgi:hypothetical protein
MIQALQNDRNESVLRALSDPRWDFRTIPGIARDVHLSEDEVASALADLGDQVRRSDVPDRLGRPVFTLKSRPTPALESLARLRNFLAKSRTKERYERVGRLCMGCDTPEKIRDLLVRHEDAPNWFAEVLVLQRLSHAARH